MFPQINVYIKKLTRARRAFFVLGLVYRLGWCLARYSSSACSSSKYCLRPSAAVAIFKRRFSSAFSVLLKGCCLGSSATGTGAACSVWSSCTCAFTSFNTPNLPLDIIQNLSCYRSVINRDQLGVPPTYRLYGYLLLGSVTHRRTLPHDGMQHGNPLLS